MHLKDENCAFSCISNETKHQLPDKSDGLDMDFLDS